MAHFRVTSRLGIFLHSLGVTISSWKGSVRGVFLRLFTAEFTDIPQLISALPPGCPQFYPHPAWEICPNGLTQTWVRP